MSQGERTPAHQWASTEATRQGILDAARAVFGEAGYTRATIAQVVERSGGSVGSLYHHFGGKAALFETLFEQHQVRQREASRAAVAAARKAGVTDPYDLFLAGTRAYLGEIWSQRDLSRIFFGSDAPAGFERRIRQGGDAWKHANRGAVPGDSPEAVLLARMLTGMVATARRAVSEAPTAQEAAQVVDTAMSVFERMRVIVSP